MTRTGTAPATVRASTLQGAGITVAQLCDLLRARPVARERNTPLPFELGAPRRGPIFHIVTSGRVAWRLTGDDTLRVVSAPALVGCLELIGGGNLSSYPPCAENKAIVVSDDTIVSTCYLQQLQALADSPSYPTVCTSLRRLAIAAGWDPFLSLYQTGAPTPETKGLFSNIRHPYQGGAPDRQLSISRWDFSSSRNGQWQAIITQDQIPSGLMLVCNGFIRPTVRLGSEGIPWVVGAIRAPALVGEFERPFSLPTNTRYHRGPIPAGATISVLPDPFDEIHEESVYTINMSYEELSRWNSEDALLEPSLAAIVRDQSLAWLRRLAIGDKYKLLVSEVVLAEWERVTSGEHKQIDTSWDFFVAQCGGDAETPKKKLELLRSIGALKSTIEDKKGRRSVSIWDVRRDLILSELAGSNRTSRATTPNHSKTVRNKKKPT